MTITSATMRGDALGLAAAVEQGWARHDREPQAVLARLAQALGAVRPEAVGNHGADAAAAIGLAEHVTLAHLHDELALAQWLAALPQAWLQAAGAAPRVALARTQWVLDQLPRPAAEVRAATWACAADGDAHAAPLSALSEVVAAAPDCVQRLRAVGNLLSYWLGRGRSADAAALFDALVPEGLQRADAGVRRALAAVANNLAVDLRLGARGDGALDALMLRAAQASKELWATVGTWLNAERAEYQLARCHAVLGLGAQAMAHAQAGLELLSRHANEPEADAFERFYAHEALGWAQLAARHADGARSSRAQCAALLAQIDDADLRADGQQALAVLDAAIRSLETGSG